MNHVEFHIKQEIRTKFSYLQMIISDSADSQNIIYKYADYSIF